MISKDVNRIVFDNFLMSMSNRISEGAKAQITNSNNSKPIGNGEEMI